MKLFTENELTALKYDIMMWSAPYENMVKRNVYRAAFSVRRYNANKNYERFVIA